MPQPAVTIVEVGLVDGLQGLSTFVSTDVKKAWIAASVLAGVREIEVTSFVPPKLLPQFADAEDVLTEALALPELQARVLIPNLKGAQRAVAAGARKLSYAFSISEAHSLSNVRKTREDQFRDFCDVVSYCRGLEGVDRPYISVGLSTAFGCSIQGAVSERDVVDLSARIIEAGADDVALADTVGYAHPTQVSRIIRAVRAEIGDRLRGIHLHDTRGLGLANAAAALDEGIVEFDASLGGLGGCPFAPGATGNVVLEDLVFMLESMGCETGIDLDALLLVRERLAGHLSGHPLIGHLAKAGLPKTYAKAGSMP